MVKITKSTICPKADQDTITQFSTMPWAEEYGNMMQENKKMISKKSKSGGYPYLFSIYSVYSILPFIIADKDK